MSLLPEQEQLLVDLVEAGRAVPRAEQKWFLADNDHGEFLHGPGGTRQVLASDVYALHHAGLGAVIAMRLSQLSRTRADLLIRLGDYSEAAMDLIQRQEHGGHKEGEPLDWEDARRVVFHSAAVMYEFAQAFEAD